MAAVKLFDPNSDKPFPLSRTKVELFVDCPRRFYLDRRLGIGRPAEFPFNPNYAVDEILKREFDAYRRKGETHPLMAQAGINAVPHEHPELEVNGGRSTFCAWDRPRPSQGVVPWTRFRRRCANLIGSCRLEGEGRS